MGLWQYLNCKILHGWTLLKPLTKRIWHAKVGYFSKDCVILSPKLNEHQKKIFAKNWSAFSPKLDEELGLFRLFVWSSSAQISMGGR